MQSGWMGEMSMSFEGGYLIEVAGDQGAGVGWGDGREVERGDCQELDLPVYLHSGFSIALHVTGLNDLARISCTWTGKEKSRAL